MRERQQELLAYLKRSGEASLEEVAAHLNLTKQGALRHLETLSAEGLVEVRAEERRDPGRPRHLYRLTAAAGERFPQLHRELAGELVHFLPADQLAEFFAARGRRLEAEYAARLAGKQGRARVEELARLATEKGHMATVVELGDGSLAIQQCNCPIGDVAAETRYPCQHEQAMYARLLGAPVERTTFMPEAASSCTYVVKPGNPGKNRTSRSRRLLAAH